MEWVSGGLAGCRRLKGSPQCLCCRKRDLRWGDAHLRDTAPPASIVLPPDLCLWGRLPGWLQRVGGREGCSRVDLREKGTGEKCDIHQDPSSQTSQNWRKVSPFQSGVPGGMAAAVAPSTISATFARGLGRSADLRPWAPALGGSSALPGPKLARQGLGEPGVQRAMGKWRTRGGVEPEAWAAPSHWWECGCVAVGSAPKAV